MFIRSIVLFACLSLPVIAQDTAYRVAAAKGPYFLCDDRVTEDRWMVERFAAPLVKHPNNPLITKTGEWEGSGPHMGGSALFDPADNLFKMWYTVFNRHNYDNRLPFSYNVAYAESDDGITWRKPALGVFEHPADLRPVQRSLAEEGRSPHQVSSRPVGAGLRRLRGEALR